MGLPYEFISLVFPDEDFADSHQESLSSIALSSWLRSDLMNKYINRNIRQEERKKLKEKTIYTKLFTLFFIGLI